MSSKLEGDPVGPDIDPSAVLAPGAIVIGQVTIGPDCFIGPNAVLRGDIDPITVGRGTNIQDCCVVHTEKGQPTIIGEEVSVGHGAIIHGCTIGDHALIGMNAVVLNGAVVGERALVGALSLVPDNFEVPPRSLAVGSPCRVVREDNDAIARATWANARRYLEYRAEHLEGRWKTVTGPLNDAGSFTR